VSLSPPAASRTREISAPRLIVTAGHDIPACLAIADRQEKAYGCAAWWSTIRSENKRRRAGPRETRELDLDDAVGAALTPSGAVDSAAAGRWPRRRPSLARHGLAAARAAAREPGRSLSNRRP
jgi:hypothetical protein